MNVFAEHHWHLKAMSPERRMQFDRLFALIIVTALASIAALISRFLIATVCTLIRNSSITIWG